MIETPSYVSSSFVSYNKQLASSSCPVLLQQSSNREKRGEREEHHKAVDLTQRRNSTKSAFVYNTSSKSASLYYF